MLQVHLSGLGDVVCDANCQLCYSTGAACPGGQSPFTCPNGYHGDDEGNCIRSGSMPSWVDPKTDPKWDQTPEKETGGALDWLKNVGKAVAEPFLSIFGSKQTPTTTVPGGTPVPIVSTPETPIYKQPVFWIVGGVGVLTLVLLATPKKKKQPETSVLVD